MYVFRKKKQVILNKVMDQHSIYIKDGTIFKELSNY